MAARAGSKAAAHERPAKVSSFVDPIHGKLPNSPQLAIPEPTAVAMLETQRILFSPAKDYPEFADVLWADSIPKLLQARLIESFENYDIAHAPLRTADIGQADFQLLIDVRRFRVAIDSEPVAEIGLSARIVDKEGKVVASRVFEGSEKFAKVEPPAVVAAFNEAFGRVARDMVAWTVGAL
jgi:phospholipid/cholesterol/gamma-HCH transport system substrate-binding protein